MVVITYKTMASSLSGALGLCIEIFSESGMVPETIEVDERAKVSFDLQDAKLVRDGKMSAEKYINRHVISLSEDNT